MPILYSTFCNAGQMETERRIRSPVADAIRLIALTGCRRGEAAGLRWRHVDLKQGRIVLPPQSHKTGRKTGKPREIVLPAEAQNIIARQTEGEPDDFVFAPARGDGAIALSKAWRKVRVRRSCRLRSDCTACGIRLRRTSPWAVRKPRKS